MSDSNDSSGAGSWTPYALAAGALLGLQFLRTTFFTRPREPPSAAVLAETQSLLASAPVVVFSKSYCPYCKSTKQLLASLGLDQKLDGAKYKVLELDQQETGPAVQDALERLTGQRTVPNVFVGGKHIGGNSDLQALHRRGQLADMLKAAGALASS